MGPIDADSKSASERSPESLLLSLPQQIRLKIYGHAVEPWVVFTHTQRDFIMKKQNYRPENYGTGVVCLPSRDWKRRPLWHPESSWGDPDEGRSEESWALEDNTDESWDKDAARFIKGPHIIPTLGYQVSIYSPLLLVNKQVTSEVTGWIASSGLRSSVHSTLRQCIFGDTLVSPKGPYFLQIMGHSRLILSLTADFSISFLERLPDDVRRHVHSIVLMGSSTQWEDGPTRLAWSKKKTERHAAYTLALRTFLPNLREVAIQISRAGLQRDMFYNYAPEELVDMLLDGFVDTVRFLYTDSYGSQELLEADSMLAAAQTTNCLACGKSQSQMDVGLLKRCGRCLKAWYCSSACQKTDWKSHRSWCQEADEVEKRKPARDPRQPRFDVVLEERVDEKNDKVLVQTASFPRNRWVESKMVVALREKSDS